MRAFSSMLLVLAMGTGCATVSAVAKPTPGFPDEYAVYSAFLDHCCEDIATASGGIHRVAAQADTTTRILWGDPGAGAERDLVAAALARMDLPPGLVTDFRRRNREPRCFQQSEFQARAPVVLVGSGPCPGTQDTAPPSPDEPLVITLSRVGFSSDGQHALLLDQFDCGPRCGSLNLIHLERRTNEWILRRSEQVVQF